MSTLDDLYREVILDHYRNPRNQGELDSPPARRAEGFNPLCGDQLVVTVDVADNEIRDIKITGTGCSISQSSASIMSAAVKHKSCDDVRELSATFKQMMNIDGERVDINTTGLGDIAALQGVMNFPVRIKCATLAWNTLLQCLDHEEPTGPVTTE